MLRRNILIFQTGGLGDFILTWPFAIGLGRIYPQSRIIYVTHQQKGELARRVIRMESTDVEAGWHALFAQGGKLPGPANGLLESAQAVYTFLPASALWHQNVERLNPAAKRVEIDARMSADYLGHITDRMAEQLKNHPPEQAALQQILRSITDRGVGYKPAGGADVVIHPGAGSPAKCWPLDRYTELASVLKNTGRTVRFIIGEVEHDRWNPADLQRLAEAGTVRSCENLIQLLDEISTAAVFIGNDSGPAHLAAMIGVPTVALFGPTDPFQWKPLGPHVVVLRQLSLDQLGVDQVLKCIT